MYLVHLPSSPYFRNLQIERIKSNSFVSRSPSPASKIPKNRAKTSSLYLLATHPRHDKVSRHLSLGGTSIKSVTTANFIEQEAQQVWWAGADCYFLSMVTGKSKTQYIAENCPGYMGFYKRRRQVISLNKSSWKTTDKTSHNS